MRTATYWHMLPEYAQARKSVWNAINPHTGNRRIDEAFPAEIRETTNDHEMFIRMKCGSTWQLVGSDNYNSLVGTPPAGIVFSEWALANPSAWAYLAPILVENGGWADFITTPRGRNHVKSMLDTVRDDPRWFSEVLTVRETGFPLDLVEEQRREYRGIFGDDEADALIEQEYFCSFEAAILGSYWGKEIIRAEAEGRVREVKPLDFVPVDTVWDLGVDDATAIWFFQVTGDTIRVLDYYEASGYGVDHYAEVKKRKGYDYKGGWDYVPHDVKQRSWTSTNKSGTKVDDKTGQRVDIAGTARQRLEVMRDLGLKPRLVPDHRLIDGINAARVTLGRCLFDKEKTADGLECLRAYQRDWDDEAKIFKPTPKRNWATHGSDSFRYLSMAWRSVKKPEEPKKPTFVVAASPTGVMSTGLSFSQLRDRAAKKRKER